MKKTIFLIIAAIFAFNICAVNIGAQEELLSLDTSGAVYSYDFDDGNLPEIFNSAMFTAENGKLKVNGASSSFTLANVPEDNIFEFKIKALDEAYIPTFVVQFGSISVKHFDNYYRYNGGNDRFTLSDRTNWTSVGDIWASNAKKVFLPKESEHTIKTVVKDKKHSLYIDGTMIFEQECTGDKMSSVVFSLAKDAVSGIYLDDIVLKEYTEEPDKPDKPEEPEEPEAVGGTYTYTFNDGILPEEFASYSIENDKLKIDSGNGGVTFKNVPGNCSFEFKIEALPEHVIPNLGVQIRKCSIIYTANNVVNKSWDDCFKGYNLEKNSEQFADAWAGGNFLPDKTGGHTVKYTAYGDTYSVYIDDMQVFSGECATEDDSESYDLKFTHSDAKGAVVNPGFYIDNIIIKGIYDAEAPSLPELAPTGKTVIYEQSFDSLTELPESGNGVDYGANKVEDGHLCALDGESFTVPSVYSDHSFEMDIRAKNQKSLEIHIDLKKSMSGYGYEVVYTDTDTGTPGSKWTLIKKDSGGRKVLSETERDTDDITSEKDTHLYIECFSSRLAVYVNDEKAAETETSMLNGVEYSSWASTEFAAKKTDEDALLINNIRLTAYPMDISDAVSCKNQKFISGDNVITSASELTVGKIKVSADASSIDPDFAREAVAVMVVFKDGQLIKAAAKNVSLPKMQLMSPENIPIELETDISQKDLESGSIQTEFYLWDSFGEMTSCGGLSVLH